MPPQPLSKVNRKATYRFGVDTFSRHSDLSPYISEVISLGAIADHEWATILIHLLKADAEAASAMYQALVSAEAKRAALTAAASIRLKGDDLALFNAVGKAVAHSRRLRNNFAHHIWADSPEVPDVLLLIEPEALAEVEVSWVPALSQNPSGAEIKSIDKTRVFVWGKKELIEARNTAREGMLTVANLAQLFAHPHHQAAAEIRSRLLSRHSVAQALQTQAPKKTRKAPQKRRKQSRRGKPSQSRGGTSGA